MGPTRTDDLAAPVTVGAGRSGAWVWATLGAIAVACLLLPVLLDPPHDDHGRGQASWRVTQTAFVGLQLAWVALVGLRATRPWTFEPEAIVLEGTIRRRRRRIPVSDIDHVLVGSPSEVVHLVSKRAVDGVALPSLRLGPLTAPERDFVRRWLAGRVPIRAADGDTAARQWAGEAHPKGAVADTVPLRIGFTPLTRRDAVRFGAIALLACGVVAALMLRLGYPLGPFGVVPATVLLMLAFLPSGTMECTEDRLRWRRTIWGRERSALVAEIDHVQERLTGELDLIARGSPSRRIGPALRVTTMAESDAAALRRWIAARLPVRGPAGDRVPWAQRAT